MAHQDDEAGVSVDDDLPGLNHSAVVKAPKKIAPQITEFISEARPTSN